MGNPHFSHSVELYENDQTLFSSLTKYFITGLANHEACIMVATPDHQQEMQRRLVAADVDIETAELTGQFIFLDAANILLHLVEDGMPNQNAFDQVVGSMIPIIPTKPIRAYGEMVALLWADGNVTGALKLEKLWNNLGRRRNFLLHCAYPSSVTGYHEGREAVEMFRLHHQQLV